jgi:hypothetical protein
MRLGAEVQYDRDDGFVRPFDSMMGVVLRTRCASEGRGGITVPDKRDDGLRELIGSLRQSYPICVL